MKVGDQLIFRTDTPDRQNISVAPGSAVITINATGPTGANLSVSPGNGANGSKVAYSGALNNLSFALSGTVGMKITVATGPSGPVVTFDTSGLDKATTDIGCEQNVWRNAGVSVSGVINEVYTCRNWVDGKKIYRATANIQIDMDANKNFDWQLPLPGGSGVVDQLLFSNGSYATGNGREMYAIGATNQGNNVSMIYLNSAGDLIFNSKTTGARNKALATVMIEYTRKDR
jgi:hypothetical protein